MAIWHPFLRVYRDLRARRQVRKEEKRLAGLNTPFFSNDYVGFKSEIWKEHLASYAGRDGLRMLEIGSFEGGSALWFVENILTGSGSLLTCVDPWHAISKLRFDHNVRITGAGDRIRSIRKGSAHALIEDLAGERFDIIYVDGSHRASDVLFDALFSWPLLKPGGMMIFDDYEWRPDLPDAERPKPAIDRFLQMIQAELEVVEIGFQVLLRKAG